MTTNNNLPLEAEFANLPEGELAQLNEAEADAIYVSMNNLFLEIESGALELTVHLASTLRTLAGMLYPNTPENEFIRNYWQGEFEKLENWFTV